MKLNWNYNEGFETYSIRLFDNTICFKIYSYASKIFVDDSPVSYWMIELNKDDWKGGFTTGEQAVEAAEEWLFNHMDGIIKMGLNRLK